MVWALLVVVVLVVWCWMKSANQQMENEQAREVLKCVLAGERLEIRLLMDGQLTECKFIYDSIAGNSESALASMVRHPEFAGTVLAQFAPSSPLEIRAIDQRFEAVDREMRHDQFWELSEELLEAREEMLERNHVPDDTDRIRNYWRSVGRIGAHPLPPSLVSRDPSPRALLPPPLEPSSHGGRTMLGMSISQTTLRKRR